MKKLFGSFLIVSVLLCGCNSSQNDISDDDINVLLQGRNQIITAIEYDTLPFDTEDKITIDGFDYYRVTDVKYDDWSEWTDFVKSIYTDEAAENVLNSNKGTSINLLHGKSSIGSVICFVIRPCKTASITAV